MAKYSLIDRFDDNKFEELARISHNLRYYSKIWKEHYGAGNLKKMIYWQNIMDEWLKENVDYSESDLNGGKLPDNCTWITTIHKR